MNKDQSKSWLVVLHNVQPTAQFDDFGLHRFLKLVWLSTVTGMCFAEFHQVRTWYDVMGRSAGAQTEVLLVLVSAYSTYQHTGARLVVHRPTTYMYSTIDQQQHHNREENVIGNQAIKSRQSTHSCVPSAYTGYSSSRFSEGLHLYRTHSASEIRLPVLLLLLQQLLRSRVITTSVYVPVVDPHHAGQRSSSTPCTKTSARHSPHSVASGLNAGQKTAPTKTLWDRLKKETKVALLFSRRNVRVSNFDGTKVGATHLPV